MCRPLLPCLFASLVAAPSLLTYLLLGHPAAGRPRPCPNLLACALAEEPFFSPPAHPPTVADLPAAGATCRVFISSGSRRTHAPPQAEHSTLQPFFHLAAVPVPTEIFATRNARPVSRPPSCV